MLDFAQTGRKGSGESGRGTVSQALTSWKLELLAVVLAVGFLAAIFVTLAHFDGQDVPNWPVSLNLNSLVAIYATVLRALLLFAIAEVISQEKWYWFRRPRALSNLDDFDHASRGVLGSIKLLPIAISSMVPFLAAITTIVLLAIGPFTQQAVKTTLCRRVVDTALGDQAQIPIAAKLPRSEFRLGYNTGVKSKSPAALNAVRAGLMAPSAVSSDALPSNCPTGNCTFPAFKGVTHSSLGLCSSCEDLTPAVTQLPIYCPSNGTNGRKDWTGCRFLFAPAHAANTTVEIGHTPFKITSSFPMDGFLTGAYINNVPFDWINVTILTRSSAGCLGDRGEGGCPNTPKYPNLTALQNAENYNFTMIGAKCSLFPCIKHYHGEIRSSRLVERVVSTSKLAPNYTGQIIQTLAAVADPCLIDGTWYDSSTMGLAVEKYGDVLLNGTTQTRAPRPCVYELQNEWMNPIGREAKQVFTGECIPVATNKGAILPYTEMYCPNWWLDTIWKNGSSTFDTISQQFDNVATAVTNHMRTVGLTWRAADNVTHPSTDADLAFVTGTTERTDLCIQFDWKWLLLPTSITFITLSLLVASVVRTYLSGGFVPAWKSSALPLLFHGFRDKINHPDHRMSRQEIKQTAKAMTASISPDEHGGCGVVLQNGVALRKRQGGWENSGESQ
ncbi:hypothetical protein B0T16DRAFT_455765 [Cercophora newfieldiana]|uniref:Uncharacterized protein n=1 Tax=Cercophora newfieldiana TaxID=92897 RepID=A0AA39YB09_9PEZI|nr:hypothetical protein B0T16DRAFT_455765 [Cercophora newfieldiana]